MHTFGHRPLTPSQQPSAWEVELGDQRPSLRHANFQFLQFTYCYWCFVGMGAGLDGSDFGSLR